MATYERFLLEERLYRIRNRVGGFPVPEMSDGALKEYVETWERVIKATDREYDRRFAERYRHWKPESTVERRFMQKVRAALTWR